jgi:hypothetical protein
MFVLVDMSLMVKVGKIAPNVATKYGLAFALAADIITVADG